MGALVLWLVLPAWGADTPRSTLAAPGAAVTAAVTGALSAATPEAAAPTGVDQPAADAGAPGAERIRLLEQQVERLLVDGRQQQEVLQHLRVRLATSEFSGQWVPLLGTTVGALLLIAVWLGLKLRRMLADQAKQRSDALAEQVIGSMLSSSESGSLSATPSTLLPLAPSAPAVLSPSTQHAAQTPAAVGRQTETNPKTESASGFSPLPTPGGESTEFSLGTGVPPRAVSVEELMDLEQQADFFIVLGQDEAAIDLLVGHLRGSGGTSPLPYIKLLELYRQRNDDENYERTRSRFVQRFNVQTPPMNEPMYGGRSLEDYPAVMAQVERRWLRPALAVAELNALQVRKADSEGFDLPAFRDVLLLSAIARDRLDQRAAAKSDATQASPGAALTPEPPPQAPANVDLHLPLGEEPAVDNRRAVRQALASRVTSSTQTLPPELMSHLLVPRAGDPDSSSLDLDLSDFVPPPREFTRPAAFTDVEMRDIGRPTGMSDFDSLEPPTRVRW